MGFPLFGRYRKPKQGAVIDIGSGSVGIGLISSNADSALPDIIYSHREPVRIGHREADDEYIRALRIAFLSALHDCARHGLKTLYAQTGNSRLDRIMVVSGAPWSATFTHMVDIEEKEPFEVRRSQIEAMIEAADKRRGSHETQSDLLERMHLSVVDKTVIETMLNGYPVSDPYGKEATSVSVAHVTGLVPTRIVGLMDDIERMLGTHMSLRMHTYALVLFCVLREIYPHREDMLVLDISGEATEIMVVREHLLLDTRSVPDGVNTLLRSLAQKLKTVPEEARMYLRNYPEETANAKATGALTKCIETYIQSIQDALQKISETYVLPRTLFLSCDHDVEPFYTKILGMLRKGDAGQRAFSVLPVKPDSLKKIAYFHNDVAEDHFLAIEARFFHKLHGCGELD